jgi:AraC-like DNA-binding protein
VDAPGFQLTASKDADALIVCAESRHAFARHYHDEYGMGLMEVGAHRSASARGQVEAGPGDVISLNPGEIHDGESIGGGVRRWRMMYFRPQTIAAAWRDASEDAGGDFELQHPAGQDARSAVLLKELFARTTQARPDAALRREELLLTLMARLGRAPPRPRARDAPSGVARAKALIDAEAARPLTLAELAQVSGLSRFQTLRAFARRTGLTPHAYQVQRRLLAARGLIAEGEALAGAAAGAGFADQSHMSRAFVRFYGYTPGAFARAVR